MYLSIMASNYRRFSSPVTNLLRPLAINCLIYPSARLLMVWA